MQTSYKNSDDLIIRSIGIPAISSIADRLLLHPLDTAYTIQQKQNLTFMQATRAAVREGGVSALYRGMSLSLVASGLPIQMSIFGTYFGLKKYLEKYSSNESQNRLISATASGFLGSLTVCPPDAKRTRDTFNIKPAQPYALRTIYRGYSMVLPKTLFYGYFVLNGTDYILDKIDKPGDPLVSFSVATVLGCLATLITTPIDVIKTKMMADSQALSNPGLVQPSIRQYVNEVIDEKMLFNSKWTRMMRFGLGAGVVVSLSHKLGTFLDKKISGEMEEKEIAISKPNLR